MLKPPFKLAALPVSSVSPSSPNHAMRTAACCDAPHDTVAAADASADAAQAANIRARLGDLDPHLHCSVIGTCLSAGELRKLMARFVFVRDSSDLEVHHEAVRFAGQGGAIAKALHKALEQRHEATVQRFSRVRDEAALASLWDEALRQGEVPGAYWAVLTHRDVGSSLRQKAFGDVHMLSHLVGAANRADIRRLVALERENGELRDRLDRQQQRSQEVLDERDRSAEVLRQSLTDAIADRDAARHAALAAARPAQTEDAAAAVERVALQTARRERAEQAADAAEEEASRLREELAHMARHVRALNRELAAAETQLREFGDATGGSGDEAGETSRSLDAQLRGRRIYYVGGRPSSTPTIRDLVLRHGGEFQHHDGGFEDRKGLLAAGVAWAQLVVFPVDCIDHDSATNLKRLCLRQQVAFMPLRSASAASFAAAFASGGDDDDGDRADSTICLKHG